MALRDMGEMEMKLKNASRKQRLAVESSDLTKQSFAYLDQAPPKPTPHPPGKEVVNEKPHIERDAVDEAKLELEDECDIAMAEREGATIDAEIGPERGARRPPPVNSDRLPLPWTGRLGYVSRMLWHLCSFHAHCYKNTTISVLIWDRHV